MTCGKKFLVDLFGPKERGMQRLVVKDTVDKDSEESEEELPKKMRKVICK